MLWQISSRASDKSPVVVSGRKCGFRLDQVGPGRQVETIAGQIYRFWFAIPNGYPVRTGRSPWTTVSLSDKRQMELVTYVTKLRDMYHQQTIHQELATFPFTEPHCRQLTEPER